MAPGSQASIFEKTKLCKFFNIGVCNKGKECFFAHSKEELRRRPDLRCTKLCPVLSKKGVCRDMACGFAHATEQRRKIGARRALEKPVQKQIPDDAPSDPLSDGIQLLLGPPICKPSTCSSTSTVSTDDTDVPWTRLCMTLSVSAGDDDDSDDTQLQMQPSPRATIAYMA
eukprot:TRINITY_DN14508_c0_g2_i1.p1 TRINITY_DN14508_c0_g2~~TRINITY_DN14508_c0_g2_i1.p1  ORF type:complete len:170 (+),score=16.82 TRINITY_DN14508_c0_g2_i1:81-590(+)